MSYEVIKTESQLPDGRTVRFVPRAVMERNKPRRAVYRLPVSLPQIVDPIDWSNSGKIAYPMDGNDTYGDCMYAAACHMDNTFTGMNGQESTFDLATLESCYKKLSGGDNGLDESQIVGEWTTGLCKDPKAIIYDSLDIDVTNPTLVSSAMYLFGGIFFMLSVPNRWINNAAPGAVWDAPASPNPMNGHGVTWCGKNSAGNYELVTWGMVLQLTPKGVTCCDPSGFVVFSPRWFNPTTGLAPNGLSYAQLAELWKEAGGKSLPASPFPNPMPHA